MNFAPKAGPLVAELLAGFTILLLAYFLFPRHPIELPTDQSALIVSAFTVVAWLLGTFIDATRNLVMEHVLDWIPPLRINWSFLVYSEQEKIARIDEYFFAFYRIDMDMAIALALFLVASRRVLSIFVQQSVGYYPPRVGLILWLATLIFFSDGLCLRHEIKEYTNEKQTSF